MAEALTTRARIVDAIAARLRGIRRPDYATDAGQCVSIGAFFFGPDDRMAVALMPLESRPVGTRHLRKKGRELDLQIGALVDSGDRDTAWLDVERLLGDIKRAVETDDDRLGGLLIAPIEVAEETALDGGEGSTVVGCSILYRVTYAETWGQP